MPFIPHTDEDIAQMLAAIGVVSSNDLFDEIPAELKINGSLSVPEGINELEISNLMQEYAGQNSKGLCFIGAGAYEHHIPAAVWDLVARGEFYSAYTPYQAEASQGTLQLLYEFQTMMANLTGMDVANASLYDGASALAEAVLMAVRVSTAKTVLLPTTLHPYYRQVVKTFLKTQHIPWQEISYQESGIILPETLQNFSQEKIAALVISQPNFFGNLEHVDELTNWAHQQNALVIAVVNPTAMALLQDPGSWGKKGADIVCGEGQPLGIPLASGGPYMGFLCCKQILVRQLPGRIVGRTVDSEGNEAFTLTLQAREQHIRRAKATSNICTNQTLLVIAATIYLSLLGAEGLRRVAAASHNNAIALKQKLLTIEGIQSVFSGPFFNEFVIRLPQPVEKVLEKLAEANIQGGFALEHQYPALKNCLLVCATETKTEHDLQEYQDKLAQVLKLHCHA